MQNLIMAVLAGVLSALVVTSGYHFLVAAPRFRKLRTVIDTHDLAKVKAQQMTGNIEWDVFDAPGALGTAGSKAGFWGPLDPQMAANSDLISQDFTSAAFLEASLRFCFIAGRCVSRRARPSRPSLSISVAAPPAASPPAS